MLQQTQVERVAPFFERFTAAFPTIEALAEAPLDDVLHLWAGLGYYSRARHLHAAAKSVVGDHGGNFPDSWEAARALPGVGDYTAGAVLSIAHGKPHAAVDANARRVLSRVLRVDVSQPRARRTIARFATEAVPADHPGAYNQALMELGSLRCRPKEPECGICCLGDVCLTALVGPLKTPRNSNRVRRPDEEVALAVVRRRGRVLIAQRPLSGVWAGLWEFPNCPVGNTDDPRDLLTARLARDFCLDARVDEKVASTSYGIMRRRFRLSAYAVSANGRTEARAHTKTRWIHPSRLVEFALPSPHQRVAARIATPRQH
ncbi:MAG: A/G-specific adenine glycosylase [Armatimonadetes bacterium]|nr:A/G-specific adenine glycosylase [Armatimonadota bacterium]